MEKNKIIESVKIAIHGKNSEIETSFSPNFIEHLQKVIRYMSVHVLLSTPNKVTYVGNSIIAGFLKDEFGGRLRHNIDRYWQGNTSISTIIQFLNVHSSVQILRFSIGEDELSSIVSGIQKLFITHNYTMSDDRMYFAYFGRYSTAQRLRKAVFNKAPHLSKYAHYWFFYYNNGSTITKAEEQKLIKIIKNK